MKCYEFLGCHANWTLFNNHCYKYFQDHLRGYSEAKAQCKTFGAFLVTVHSKEENDYLWSLFSPSGHAVWAGGNDEQVEGSWVWEDGVAWGSFVFWNRGEPNGGSRENCISMRHQDGKWNDLHCTTLSYYICKNWHNNCLNLRCTEVSATHTFYSTACLLIV